MLNRTFAFLIFAALYATCAICASAQLPSPREPVEIRGQIRYAQGGAPASDVIVRLDQLSGGYVTEMRTDRLGRFRFSNLSPIQYHVIIRHFGYQEIVREVNLVMSASDYVQLQLVPEASTAPEPPPSSSRIVDASVPPAARKEFEKSDQLLASGHKDRIREGTRHLEKAVSIYPKFLEAQLKLGAAYMDLQQWDKAEQVLLQALQNSKDSPNVLFALGELYIQTKKSAEAEKVLRQGLQIEPRAWQGHYGLGRLYWNNGEIFKASKQVALTLQLNPKLAEAHLLAGNILLRAHKPDDAKFEFEEYLRLSPNGKYAAQTKEVVKKIAQASNKKQ